jgi:hypothetical protein
MFWIVFLQFKKYFSYLKSSIKPKAGMFGKKTSKKLLPLFYSKKYIYLKHTIN